jgi:general nucleoside transport system ATP-binding protein
VLGLGDRIAVMYRGVIAGEVPAGTGAEVIGLLMAGASADEAQAQARPLSAAAAGSPQTGGLM